VICHSLLGAKSSTTNATLLLCKKTSCRPLSLPSSRRASPWQRSNEMNQKEFAAKKGQGARGNYTCAQGSLRNLETRDE